jgi:CHAT domain-containing protein/tetratricopeptide (TPR) repeat protein
MKPSSSPLMLRLVLLVALSLIAPHAPAAETTPAYGAAEDCSAAPCPLTPRKAITQLLARERAQTFSLSLLQNQYVSLLITKEDAGLQVLLRAPDGRPPWEFVGRRYGPVRLSFIAPTPGDYVLEVRALDDCAARCEYTLQLEAVRAATERDRQDAAAVRAYAEAEKLRADWAEESSRIAAKRYTEAAARWQAAARTPDAADALRAAGDTLFALSEYPAALAFYHRALRLSHRAGDRRGMMRALNSIGYVHVNTDDKESAWAYFRSVSNFYRRLRPAARSPADLRVTAEVENNLGEVFYYRGDPIKAGEYFNRALELHLKAGDRRGAALAYLNLGYTYLDSGDLTSSWAHLTRALTLWGEVDDKRGEAHTYAAQGLVLSFRGEKQGAFDVYQQALRRFRTIGDRQGEAALLNSMGSAYEDLNEPQVALDHYTRARELFKARGMADAVAVTDCYVGHAQRALKNEAQALEAYGRCLSLSHTLGKRRIENYARLEIASIYAAKGQRQPALESYHRALRFYRGLKDRRGHAHALNSIGDLYLAADWRRALSYYRQALGLSRVAEDQREEAATLYKIARAERDSDDLQQALADIKAALQIGESLRTKVGREDLRSAYFASVHDQYLLYIDLLMRLHARQPTEHFDVEALQASEAARARTLVELLASARLDVGRGVSPELLERERLLEQSLSARAERQVFAHGDGGRGDETGEAANETRRLTTEYQEVEGEIREQGLRRAAFVPASLLRLADIQRELLDDDTLLLEYALGDEKSYLWAVTKSSLSSHELPPRADIEGAAREVYRMLAEYQAQGQTPRADDAALNESYWRAAGAMSRILLEPVAAQLGHKRLLIVADGALQYIPFEALPAPAGDAPTPLVLEHEVVSLPSVSTLAALRHRAARPEPAPDKLIVVVADPVFEPDDPRLKPPTAPPEIGQPEPLEAARLRSALRDVRQAGVDSGLPRLPFTLQEAQAIIACAPAGQARMVTGFEASRALAVGGELNRYRVVHLATHGVINCQHPELSGIVLSMLNERGGRENGFLQLHDIYKLDLSADLVVLSACSTGLGEEIRGEGLVGLTQGFLHVGARSVVASLWQVDDRATAELMRHFYRAMFDDGLPPAAALREAKKAMWREPRWRAPYFWAAFVLQGEYRESMKPSHAPARRMHYAFGILLLFAAVLAIITLRARRGSRRTRSTPAPHCAAGDSP